MKKKLALSFLFFAALSGSQGYSQQLVKLWESDTTLKVPESVYFDADNKVLYVSNIDGQPAEKDGKGSIGKVGTDGKVIAAEWVTGLNSPKGMALYKNTLWVSDLNELVSIDIKSGTITNRIAIDSAVFLNDVTVDKDGAVYVSDSRTGKVHKVVNGKAETWLQGLKGPNGLLAHKKDFYVLDQGVMYKVEKDKSLKKITEGMEGGTDGIENVKGDDFIVSCWSGVVYYVKGDGSKEKLLDTRDAKINSADIGYDSKNRIVYVPTFWKNNVVAYTLK